LNDWVSRSALAEVIDRTQWIDTHEHLVEEQRRLGAEPYVFTGVWGAPVCIPGDWTALLAHYAVDDLVSAGLAPKAAQDLLWDAAEPLEKWDTVEAALTAARNTGFVRAVDLATERLFGRRLARDTCEDIDAACRALRAPGWYARVLTQAGVDRCQVNSLEDDPFCESDQPALLEQDLSLYPLASGNAPAAERRSGIAVGGLDDYLDVVEWCFERFAPHAVAVKLAWAYFRPLAVSAPGAPPRAAFARIRRGESDLDDRRAVEDFLLGRCIELATEHGLPLKLHLGHLAGTSRPELRWVPRHVADVVPLVHGHPRTRFVLMHAGWPQQEQLLSVAKHFPNVVVDLCWAWSLAPRSTTDFVQRFLTTVPASKLLCFGGDSMVVETVVGHAELARRGLEAALGGLVRDDWLTLDAALDLVPPLMRGNALRIFG
jgi:uncharacterized protein